MKLVPFWIQRTHRGTLSVLKINVFLAVAGKRVWKSEESGDLSEDTLRNDYCEPNGLAVLRAWREPGIAYLQIDPSKTSLSEFYSWEEALAHPSKPECWRPFYWIVDPEGKEWWTPNGVPEAELGDYGSIASLCGKVSQLVES